MKDNNTDNRVVKKDGGYLFPGWNIHIIATSVKEAKEKMLEFYGVDVDKDDVPPKIEPADES